MKYIILLFILLSFYSSCTIERKIYSPTQVNNPSLQKKNDYSASLTYSTPSGFDGTAGFAITKNLAVIGGAYTYKNKDEEVDITLFSRGWDSASIVYKHSGFHIGVGTFFPLSKNSSTSFLSFFGGLTKGNFEMREKFYDDVTPPPGNPNLYFYKSEINRWFLQGSINLYFKDIYQSFTTRFNYAGYDNVTTNYPAEQQHYSSLPPYEYSKWSSFLDFSFDTKIFFSEQHRLGLQLFGSVTTRLKEEDFDFYIYPFRMGFGVVLRSPFTGTQLKK